MKTLYIHGLDSSPRPDKIALLKQIGLEVYSLHLEYRKERETSYDKLKKYAKEKDIEFLIGSSMGGFFAYYLSEELALPCLLFNPAMHFDKFEIQPPKVQLGYCPKRFVILGERDDVVDPKRNHTFFESLEINNVKQRIVSCNWLSHQIDLSTLREMTIWAMAALE